MKRARKKTGILLFILPSLTGVILFVLCPLAKAIYCSFFDKLDCRNFVGLKNYSELMKNPAFLKAVGNTGRFYAIALVLVNILPLAGALLFTDGRRVSRIFDRTVYLTILLPTASLMTVIGLIFSRGGLLAYEAAFLFGLDADKLYDSPFAFILLVMLFVYKYGGYNFLIYRAAISSIPREFYEEAMLAGAGRIGCAWYVTLPGILPVMPVVLMLSLMNSYKIYREAYLIGGNYPDESIYLIQHFISNNFVNMNYSRLCAVTSLILILALSAAGAVYLILRAAKGGRR